MSFRINGTVKKNVPWNCRHGTVEMNLTRNHEVEVRSLALLSGLRIWRCCEPPYAAGAALKRQKKKKAFLESFLVA